jgi:hypothetical protein
MGASCSSSVVCEWPAPETAAPSLGRSLMALVAARWVPASAGSTPRRTTVPALQYTELCRKKTADGGTDLCPPPYLTISNHASPWSGCSNVVPLSAFRASFGKDYGLNLVDGPLKGLTARAVIVLDENDKVLLSQLVPEITSEPDYAAVSNALGR